MIINKNNGIILIEEIEVNRGYFIEDKALKQYSIIVKDKEEKIRLEATLRILEVRNSLQYKFKYSLGTPTLANYIVEELKKYNIIKS